jgi:hypothetical protein
MSHYQLCPKCNGQGIVSKPPWLAGDINTWIGIATSYPCNACNGMGLLLVPDNTAINPEYKKC